MYGDLLRCVHGCVFFGVPHRGAETAYWANFGANVIKVAFFGRTNTNFVAALQRNSRTFADISQQFVERGASLMIRTFYETETLYNQLVCRCDTCAPLAYDAFAELESPVDRGQGFGTPWSCE